MASSVWLYNSAIGSPSAGGWTRTVTDVALTNASDTLSVAGVTTFTAAVTTGAFYAGGIIDDDSSGSFQVLSAYNAPTSGFQAGYGLKATLTTTADTSATLESSYFDVFYVFNHNSSEGAVGHDFTNNISVAGGKTVGGYNSEFFGASFTGPGTVASFQALDIAPAFDATQVTEGYSLVFDGPDVSNGAAIGTWYHIKANDLSSLTVGTAKGFINYGAGKFVVDSAGDIVTTGYLQGTEMSAPSAGTANTGRIFFQDNGGGKTQLMVIFASGAAQQLAIQP